MERPAELSEGLLQGQLIALLVPVLYFHAISFLI